MARGGKRAGAGRPKGARNKRTVAMIEDAKRAGLLPHEFLAAVARGEGFPASVLDPETNEPIPGVELTVYPSLDQRIQCATAAAPFFAPRLSSLEHSGQLRVTKDAAEYSDDELIAIIELHQQVHTRAIATVAGAGQLGRGDPAPEKGEILVSRMGKRRPPRTPARKAP